MRKNSLISIILIVHLVLVVIVLSDFTKFVGTFSGSRHSKNDSLFYWDFVIPYAGNQMSDRGFVHITEINEYGYTNVDTYNLILVP